MFNTLSFPEMKGTLVVLLWTDCDSFVHGAPLLKDKNLKSLLGGKKDICRKPMQIRKDCKPITSNGLNK